MATAQVISLTVFLSWRLQSISFSKNLANILEVTDLSRSVVTDPSAVRYNNLRVVETSVTVNNNSPIQDQVHRDDQTQPTFEMTPGFKPFTALL